MKKLFLSMSLFLSFCFISKAQTDNYFAPNAPTANTGSTNTFLGVESGKNNTSGSNNTYVGRRAGFNNTTGGFNVFLGHTAGSSITTSANVVIGANAAGATSGGAYTAIGVNALQFATTGINNTALGASAGRDATTGSSNVFIGVNAGGTGAGASITGSDNTFIGKASTSSLGSISNSTAVGADVSLAQSNTVILGNNANVGMGTSTPRRKLEVNGEAIIGGGITNLPAGYNLYVANGVLTEKVTIAAKNTVAWADFVFEKNYKLRTLTEVESFINKNGHLPEVPSTQEVQTNGMNLAENDAKLLQKIEELTLYMIAQEKKIKLLEKRIVKRK